MKKLVATEPRVAALVEYEDRAVSANEVKVRVKFGAPKHGTEVVDFVLPARLLTKILTVNGKCLCRVRKGHHAGSNSVNSSLAIWWWAMLLSVAAM